MGVKGPEVARARRSDGEGAIRRIGVCSVCGGPREIKLNGGHSVNLTAAISMNAQPLRENVKRDSFFDRYIQRVALDVIAAT